ncbi:lipopolysaccharide heptosyltransferase II [Endozoicomonas sp. Mp262]|uniref:lipopolysaccharide heptosyltransferase II n=1 Tax=Endozoicomonas sp. Mp262 TaxID=2919499 RepID=UPI0021DB3B30
MKYLIVGPSWVGDMVMAQTLFITLKQQNPDAKIDVLAPAWSGPILQRMPEVHRSIEMPLGHGKLNLGTRKKIGHSLRVEHYNQAIVLPNSFKSALIPFWANIPIRTGWRGEMRFGLLNDIRALDKEQLPLMVERFVALGYPKGQAMPSPLPRPQLQVEPASVDSALHRHRLQVDAPILGLCPGAEFGPSKQWPAGYYGEVALNLLKQGWRVWLFGSEKDRQITTEIMSYIPDPHRERCCNLAGETTLADAVDLLSKTTTVVSNDSGLMHIAAALSRPLVAVYGSTTASHTPPMNTNSKTLWLKLECSPCFKRECPLGHHNCMKQLDPDMVMAAIEQLGREQHESLIGVHQE